MTFLLDTDVVSEVRKPSPDPAVVAWLHEAVGPQHISVMVVAELQRGVELLRKRAPVRARELDRWVETTLRQFADRTIPVSGTVARTSGTLHAVRPLGWADAVMAATAIVHDLTLVTRNVKDFAGLDVRLLNPFDD
jgi:predicted nucleic acid-binding protein